AKLIGASCTLVISHQQNMVGKTYANIDAISKPTKKVAPSGMCDPAAARQRYAEWKTRQAGSATSEVRGASGGTPNIQHPTSNIEPGKGSTSPQPSPQRGEGGAPKSGAPAPAPTADFDPEVGF
ncbi:MAG TPA: hypothetical protein VI136_00015, partial [Verrucomicrobiae bacterium]